MNKTRKQLMMQNSNTAGVRGDIYIPLTNHDFNAYDPNNNLVSTPYYCNYLDSNSFGTSFNRTIGHGILYTSNINNIKSVYLEVIVNEISGTAPEKYGGIISLLTHGSSYGNKTITMMSQAVNNIEIGYSLNESKDKTFSLQKEVLHKVLITTNYEKGSSSKTLTGSLFIDGIKILYSSGNHRYIVSDPQALCIANSWRLPQNGPASSDTNPFCGIIRNVNLFHKQFTDEEGVNLTK